MHARAVGAAGLLWLIWIFLSTLDIVISHQLERRDNFYPLVEFFCFCGKQWKDPVPEFPIPIRLYRFYQLKRHLKACLPWIMNAEANGLTPYWGSMLVHDLLMWDLLSRPPYITEEWLLKKAMVRSRRVKEGRDPFDDSDGLADELMAP